MIINLSPQVTNKELTITKSGDCLTINGVELDFSPLQEGWLLPSEAVGSDFVFGQVRRINGEVNITILLPIKQTASESARFPAPFVSPPDGILILPE